MKRSVSALTAALVLSSACVAAAHAAPAHPSKVACTGNPAVAHRLDIAVAGERAFGYYAVPSRRAKGIVVFDHGYSHTAWNWRQHLTQVANRDGVIAIAMDYRHQVDSAVDPKTGLSSSRGWRAQAGPADAITAGTTFTTS